MNYADLYPPYRYPPTYQSPPWFAGHSERYAPVPGWGMNLQLARPRTIGVSGFGLDVPYVDPSGKSQIAVADASQPGCSAGADVHAIQQMLKDLGYYQGPIDGVLSTALLTASAAFGNQAQLPVGSPPTAACAALIAAWQAKKSADTQRTVLVVAGVAAVGLAGYFLWRKR